VSPSTKAHGTAARFDDLAPGKSSAKCYENWLRPELPSPWTGRLEVEVTNIGAVYL
jgi:hypothetical protein